MPGRVCINQGKTHVWNRSGDVPPACEHLFFNADGEPSGVRRGDHSLPTHEQGIAILGAPLGHADFVQDQLEEKWKNTECFKSPSLPCAWLLLLSCAASRASCVLRVVHPALCFRCAQMRATGIRECLQALLRVPSHSRCGKWQVFHLRLEGCA